MNKNEKKYKRQMKILWKETKLVAACDSLMMVFPIQCQVNSENSLYPKMRKKWRNRKIIFCRILVNGSANYVAVRYFPWKKKKRIHWRRCKVRKMKIPGCDCTNYSNFFSLITNYLRTWAHIKSDVRLQKSINCSILFGFNRFNYHFCLT